MSKWPISAKADGKKSKPKITGKIEPCGSETKVIIRIRAVTSYVIEEHKEYSNAAVFAPIAKTDSKANAQRIAKVWRRAYEKDGIPNVTVDDQT